MAVSSAHTGVLALASLLCMRDRKRIGAVFYAPYPRAACLPSVAAHAHLHLHTCICISYLACTRASTHLHLHIASAHLHACAIACLHRLAARAVPTCIAQRASSAMPSTLRDLCKAVCLCETSRLQIILGRMISGKAPFRIRLDKASKAS